MRRNDNNTKGIFFVYLVLIVCMFGWFFFFFLEIKNAIVYEINSQKRIQFPNCYKKKIIQTLSKYLIIDESIDRDIIKFLRKHRIGRLH